MGVPEWAYLILPARGCHIELNPSFWGVGWALHDTESAVMPIKTKIRDHVQASCNTYGYEAAD